MGSNKKPNKYLSLIAWLLPSGGFKRWALRALGNNIADDALIAPQVVLGCGVFSVGESAIIERFNIFRNLATIRMDGHNLIGSWNQFTAAPEYQSYSDRVGMLWMKEHSFVTNRHYVDCSGQVILGAYAAIAGIKSIFQSHELDLVDNKTTIGRVVLADRAVTSTACVMLKDSFLPERSMLAAGAVMVKAKEGSGPPPSGLYGGTPARFIKEIKNFAWWDRDTYDTQVTAFDDRVFQVDGYQPEIG
jgi:acetyltransferase-like isoleucine patch superfamily enzyme